MARSEQVRKPLEKLVISARKEITARKLVITQTRVLTRNLQFLLDIERDFAVELSLRSSLPPALHK